MNVRISQNTWEVPLQKADKNQGLNNKQTEVGFGRELANSLKNAKKTGYQNKPPSSMLNGAREIKLLNNPPKEQLSKTDGEGKIAVAPEEVSLERPQELSVATNNEETKQVANLEQQSWWLEFIGLLNMLAKLGGLEEAELQVLNCSVSELAEQVMPASDSNGQVVPAAKSAVPEMLVTQLTGQEQTIIISLPDLTVVKESELSVQFASIPGTDNFKMLSLMDAGLEQTEGNEEAQLVQPKVLVNNQGELQKLAASLKPILEQLVQGKVTVATAVETILKDNGLMEQLASQVKLLKLQLATNKQLVDVETTVPDQPQEGLVQPKLTSSVGAESPEKATKVTTSSEVPVNQVGKQNQQLKPLLDQVTNEGKAAKTEVAPEVTGDGESSREVTAVRTLPGAEPILNEIPERLWALHSISQKEGSALELAEAVKNQVPRMAREIANQMVFKQIVDNSYMLIGKDHSEVKIQLKPEFLGKVSLEISIERGVVKAEIVADNQQVKQLIEANLGNLRQTLTNQGLKVNQLVVNLGGQSQFGQAKEQGQNTGRGTRKQQNTEVSFEIGDITREYGLDLAEANQMVDYKI